jgi:hypothetical protein
MTRDELLKALRTAGYTGPVSYPKGRLQEILDEVQSESQDTVAPPADQSDADWEGAEVKLTEWRGLKASSTGDEGETIPGTVVRIEGLPRKRFEFVSYYHSSSQEYVTVRGPLPNHRNNRYITPDRILFDKTKKPVAP